MDGFLPHLKGELRLNTRVAGGLAVAAHGHAGRRHRGAATSS